VLESPVLARCPSCRNTFETERTGPQDCPSCGKPLVVPETAVPSTTETSFPPAGEPSQEQGTPWERRAELGFWRGWWETVVQALFEPGRLFRSARLDRGAAQTGFAVLTVSVPWFIGQMLDAFLVRPWTRHLIERAGAWGPFAPWLQKIAAAGQDTSPRATLLLALLSPLLALVGLYANAAVTHVAALLLGQAKRGFAATFAACAYASAPLLLTALPGCGAPIGIVWTIVLTGVGLKETHRIAPGGAAAAVLVPYALLCCAVCVLGLLGGFALRGVPS
jgi:hypothetical protein